MAEYEVPDAEKEWKGESDDRKGMLEFRRVPLAAPQPYGVQCSLGLLLARLGLPPAAAALCTPASCL